MNPKEWLMLFLRNLGCSRQGDYFILDGWDGEFYLMFDTSDQPDHPEYEGTCDIYVAFIGSSPRESKDRIRVVSNCGRHKIMRFLFALGVSRFKESTREFLYQSNQVIKSMADE